MQIFFSSNLFDSKLTVTFNSLVVLLGIRSVPLFAAPPPAVPSNGIICGSAQDGNGIKVKCCQTFAPLDSIRLLKLSPIAHWVAEYAGRTKVYGQFSTKTRIRIWKHCDGSIGPEGREIEPTGRMIVV